MLHPIFLNNGVGLRDESATFLHNFSSLYLHIIRKWLTICVFAGLTRNLILSSSNATRCVPTPLIGCSAGSRPARKMRKNTPIVPRRLLNESERFSLSSPDRGNHPNFPPFPASLQRSLPNRKERVIYNIFTNQLNYYLRMSKKFSTLMASLLFASAFVGTADAAIKIVDMSKAPAAGKYIIATALDVDSDGNGYVDNGKATGVFTNDPAAVVANPSSGAVVTNFSYVWTIEKDGSKYYFKAPNGKYVKMTNAAGGDAHVAYADSKSDAVAFSYNTSTKNFEVTMNVGSTPHNCILGVYTDNKPVIYDAGTATSVSLAS